MEVCFGTVGGTRRIGRECRRAIQKRKPADGAEHPSSQPAWHGVPTNRTDGYHDYLSPAGSGRAGDLGQDRALWKSLAVGREREYDDYFLRRCLRGSETPCGGHVWVAHHPGQRSVDGDFFEELDFLGQLQLRRERGCAARERETARGGIV